MESAQRALLASFRNTVDAVANFAENQENMKPLEEGMYEDFLVGDARNDTEVAELTPESLILKVVLGLTSIWQWVVPTIPLRQPGRSRPDFYQYFAAAPLQLFELLPITIAKWNVEFQLLSRACAYYSRYEFGCWHPFSPVLV